MIRKPTTLVLGAGASHTYGFPLGKGLVTMICNELTDPDGPMRRLLRATGMSSEILGELHNSLRWTRPESIDVFLTRNPELREVGKAAIAACLVPREHDAAIYDANEGHDWYRYLFTRMLGRSLSAFKANRLQVVTFNFDRSFERAMFLAVRDNFRVRDSDAAEACATVPIVHLHGALGEPRWLKPDAENARPYQPRRPRLVYPGDPETTLDPQEIIECASALRLFDEGCDDAASEDALALFQKSERVLFLGFGYQADNVRKLQCGEWWTTVTEKNGTIYGMPPGEVAAARRQFPEPLPLRPEPCLDFLRNSDYIHDD